MKCSPALLVLLPSLCCCPSSFAAAGDETVPAEPAETREDIPFGLGWLDDTQAYATDRANTMANQIDRFFGVPRSDIEAAYSSLRLTLINSWSRIDGPEMDLRLRGKLHLPRINERISLIFSEDDGDGSSYYQQGGLDDRQRDTRVNLEFNFLDTLRDRLDFRLGLSSSLKARASVRYRYEQPFAEDYLHRLTQTAYFKDGKGFGSITRYQIDRALGENGLLRWNTDVRFEESFTGAEWNTGLSYSRRESDDSGVIYYGRVSGLSGPDYIAAYDLGVRFRRNIWRPWLFLEVEPGYTWQKEALEAPREHSPYVFLRFEMAIGRLDD